MDREETIVKELKEHWFKDHKAVLTKRGDLEVLDWRKPGTSNYAVRYVFDGYRMYIGGDIGEAIFNLTWKAHIDSFNDVNIGYFVSKMAAGEKTTWDSEAAVESLTEWKNERLESPEDYFEDKTEQTKFEILVDNLICAADDCNSKEQWSWQYVNGEYESDISKYDADYWEWMYDIGNVVPYHTYGFLIGLQMASEQLKNIREKNRCKITCELDFEGQNICCNFCEHKDTCCNKCEKVYGECGNELKESEVEQ